MTSSTIESTHNKILERFAIVYNIYEQLRDNTAAGELKHPVNIHIDELEELENKYKLATINVISRYYAESLHYLSPKSVAARGTIPAISAPNASVKNIINVPTDISIEEPLPSTHIASVVMASTMPAIPALPPQTIPADDIELMNVINELAGIKPDISGIREEQLQRMEENIARNSVIVEPDDETSVTQRYYQIVVSENFVATLDEYIARAKQILTELNSKYLNKKGPKYIAELLKRIYRLETGNVSIDCHKTNYQICGKCNKRMTFFHNDSVLRCDLCGMNKKLEATAVELQEQSQETTKSKQGSYDVMRHLYFWVDRLQAREKINFPEYVDLRIDYIIKRDNYTIKTLNCERMRDILKEARLTRYNDNIATLVKIKTGKCPPQLTHEEIRIIAIRFSKTIEIYELIKPDGDSNSRYYPYFILKIIEDMFKDDPDKLSLREYIHLQSWDTVLKHDQLYREICLKATEIGEVGFVYRPTERYLE